MAKRITWLINNITQVGGIERVVCNVSNLLQKEGFRLKIASLNTTSGQPYFELSKNITVEHLGYPESEMLNRKKLKHFIGNFLKTEDAKSDIIITCHSPIAVPVLQQKSLYHGKIICTDHAAWEYYTKARKVLNAFYYRRADKVVVLTDRAKKIYQRYGFKNLAVIPNIITDYPKTLAPLKSKELIAIGRFAPEKGYDRIIEAINLIKDNFTPWHISIYGDGDEKTKLESLIKQYDISKLIEIKPFTNEVQAKLHACSGYIMSSHNEAFPMVTLEALSNGVPIISFDIPSLREIDHGSNTIIFAEQNNITDFAQKILAYTKTTDRKPLSQKSHELSLNYSAKKVIPLWVELLS